MAEVTYKHVVKPYQITLGIFAVLVNCTLEKYETFTYFASFYRTKAKSITVKREEERWR